MFFFFFFFFVYRATCHIRPDLPSFRQWAKVMEHTQSRGKGKVLVRGKEVDPKKRGRPWSVNQCQLTSQYPV